MRKTAPIRMMMPAMGAKNELTDSAMTPTMIMKSPTKACHNGVAPIIALWVPAGGTMARAGLIVMGIPHARQNVEPGTRAVPQRSHIDITQTPRHFFS